MPDLKAYPQNPSELAIVSDVLGIITAQGPTVNVGKKGKPSSIVGQTPAAGQPVFADVNEVIMTYPDGSKYKISVYATQLNKSAGIL